MSHYYFEDFTFANLRRLLRIAKSSYQFIGYTPAESARSPSIIWRHDIDVSVHRAHKLAILESEEGIGSTYFVQPSSLFYNIFESDIKTRLSQIAGLGHSIGLHFDPSCHSIVNADQLEKWLRFERGVLEGLLEIPVDQFSFHVPTTVSGEFVRRNFAGMTNVYAAEFGRFKYCSDSNGYWRHDRLEEILDWQAYPFLHVLTHPEYWTDDVMSPNQRIKRCIEGRAQSTQKRFDSIVRETGRQIPDWNDEACR